MNFLFAIILLITPPDFSKFTYCIEKSRGPYERQCIELNPDGKGQGRFKRRGSDEIKVDIGLSDVARDRFLGVIAATNNLEQGDSYESGKKVADLGKKHMTLETSGGKREAEFNYSLKKEVVELAGFFDGIINEETFIFDIENAIQYDRLAIPKWLERLDNELKSNRISDPERLIPLLDKIQADTRIVNYTRAGAGKMKEQILKKKTPK